MSAKSVRRLAAIMFTDIVGYSALTQSDESQALVVLERHNRLLRPLFRKFKGREVKTMGDSFLVEFSNCLDATDCAIEIQKFLHDYNVSSKEDWKIKLRIGIHQGDVIDKRGDIFGDTVNIASRIQPLAEPEGVCISDQVYYQIKNKVDYTFERLEHPEQKNIKFPTSVYKVVMPWQSKRGEDRGKIDAAASVPDRKRIAVLPFTNISPDPNDEYFADGMTEELISTLSKIRGLKVIARTSVMGYKRTGLRKINEVANELGVGTILEGSVRKAGDRLRITAQLIDCASSNHIWSESYNREMKDVFLIQSDISETVAEALKVKLLAQERESIETASTHNMESYSFYLKGRALLHSRERKSILDAKEQFEQAIRLDAFFAQAYAGLADTLLLLYAAGYENDRDTPERAKALASKALELNPNFAEAHCSLAMLLNMFDHKFEQAEREFKTAIALNPSYATAHHWYSIFLVEEGRLEEGMKEAFLAEEADPLTSPLLVNLAYLLENVGRLHEAFERIEKLSKIDLRAYYYASGYYYLFNGDFQRALDYLEREIQLTDPQFRIASDFYFHGCYYALTGQKDKASECIKKLEQLPEEQFPRNRKPLIIAEIYELEGDMDNCFEWLEGASGDYPTAVVLRGYPSWRNIREDPRFDALIKKIRTEN